MVTERKFRAAWIAAVLTCVLLGLSMSAMAQTEKPKPEQFSATVYPQAGVFAGRMTQINMYVSGYTPDDEANQLRDLLKTKGPDALLNTIEKLKEKGRGAVVGTTGWGIPVIRQHPLPGGGRRLVFFGNRPLSFYEARDQPRSAQYPFGLMVLNLNDKGEGEGLLYVACKVKFNKKGEIEIENYGIAPSKIVNVKQAK